MFLWPGLDWANQLDPLQQFRLNENGLLARCPGPAACQHGAIGPQCSGNWIDKLRNTSINLDI
jgi:hypothetical protein